jgi:hypothetical protein
MTDPNIEFIRSTNVENFTRQLASAEPGPRRDMLLFLLKRERTGAWARPDDHPHPAR